MTNKLEYQITYIPLKHLSVMWIASQRPYNEKWAQDIGKDFDPDKFEPVCVTKPNGVGQYHIIDGQHRAAGALIFLKDPNQCVPCRIISEADPARAAEVFLGINEGRRGVRPISSFMIAVTSDRELEVAINDVVKKIGYHVGDTYKKENAISAVVAMKKIYRNYGVYILQKTLEICRQMWGSDSRGVSGQIITGLGVFLNEFHLYVDKAHLCDRITNKYKSPGNFISAVRIAKNQASVSMDVAMSDLIRSIYNHGLRDNKKLKRKE